MKHPVKKTMALLTAACFLTGNAVVFADSRAIYVPEVNSNLPVGASVDIQGQQPDGTPGNITVRGDETTYYPQGSPDDGQQDGHIDFLLVDVEKVTNQWDRDSYLENQPGDEGPVSTGLYISNAGAYEVEVHVERDITNTGKDLDQTIGIQTGHYCDGETDIQINGEVNAIAEGGTNMVTGIDAEVTSGRLSISANNVAVEGEAEATGVDLNAGVDRESWYYGNVEANFNDISVSSKGNVTGVNVQLTGGDANVTTGNITVETTKETTGEGTPEDQSSAGVRINLSEVSVEESISSANVTTKDIIATGENTVGIEIIGMMTEYEDSPNSVNIISDGTVSGDAAAVRVHCAEKEDNNYINLTLWSVKENENGQIVNVNGSLSQKDLEVAAAIEARINYIIKLADGWKDNISITTAKGRTEVIDGQTYNTANENEIVTLKVNVPVLDGIFYTDGDDNTYTAVNNLTRNADGSYSIKMLRGGSMLLGLKTHTHNGLDRQENTDTGYDIVTYCTICGAELGRVHYNHSPSAQPPAVSGAPMTAEVSLAPAAEEAVDIRIAPGPEDSPVISAFNAQEEQNAAIPSPIESKRFVEVDENTAVHGVKAADRLPIEEAFAVLGKNLNDEQATVTIENLDRLLDAMEMTQFESLAASDRLLVLLAVLSNSDFLQAQPDNMEPGAKALAETITTRISNMPDTAKEEFNRQIQSVFDVKKVFIDGQEADSISFELTITKGNEETKERYCFYNSDDVWILYRIEQLQTVTE